MTRIHTDVPDRPVLASGFGVHGGRVAQGPPTAAGSGAQDIASAGPISASTIAEDALARITQMDCAFDGMPSRFCYHPLFCFNQFGDLERSLLRPGNVHSAEDWRVVMEPVVKRYRERQLRRYFRADAAFAKPEIHEFLETEGYAYAIRVPTNAVLQNKISNLLTRPVERPPNQVAGQEVAVQVAACRLGHVGARWLPGRSWQCRPGCAQRPVNSDRANGGIGQRIADANKCA